MIANPSSRSSLAKVAKRHARARAREGGAVMFVVVTTLGVLAALGLYGLTATKQDVHAAGNVRQWMQARHAAEFGAVAAADYVTYENADYIINTRMLNPPSDVSSSQRNCLSAQKNLAGLPGSVRAKSCIRVSKDELKLNWNNRAPFTSIGLGDSTVNSDIYIELTNPMATAPPPGFDLNLRLKFAQVTVTTYGIISPAAAHYEGMRVGRGRFIVGPLNQ